MFSFFKKKLPLNSQTVTLQIQGLQCTSCSLSIDGLLESTQGVIESNTSYAKSQTKITFNPNIINTNKLIDTINQLGYQVADN